MVWEPGAVGSFHWQGQVPSEALPSWVNAFGVLADARGKEEEDVPGCRMHREQCPDLDNPKCCRGHFIKIGPVILGRQRALP